jgi:hypothetical protein
VRIAPALILVSLSLTGCAAVFRGTKDHVRVESNPPGAQAKEGNRTLGTTPTEFEASRSGNTYVTLQKSGYEDHHGMVKKEMNGAWVVIDIVTCPFTLCIPLLVDAITGGWQDVDHHYDAQMKPAGAGAVASASTAPATTAPAANTASAPPIDMSEGERKATARAAYMEGVKLQEAGNCPEALPRLEAAQKFFSAPTHLLHIGQCQAALGKLVEASETYETLVRMNLAKDSPEVFLQSQEEAKKELGRIKPRIPTLRVQISPPPSSLSSLVVKLNGSPLPNEVLGIARPVNPGRYKVTVWAAGYKEATQDVEVGEGVPKAVELRLAK